MREACGGDENIGTDPRWEQSKHLGGIYPNMGRLGAGMGTLDMHASGIWAAVQGAHLKPLFGKPPRLPENHRWVFALIDAGVPSDLSASSPTFLMAPGQDVLHGTMCTGKADGTDHVEHGAGGSALMNKRKLTSDTARKYRAFDRSGERRSIG